MFPPPPPPSFSPPLSFLSCRLFFFLSFLSFFPSFLPFFFRFGFYLAVAAVVVFSFFSLLPLFVWWLLQLLFSPSSLSFLCLFGSFCSCFLLLLSPSSICLVVAAVVVFSFFSLFFLFVWWLLQLLFSPSSFSFLCLFGSCCSCCFLLLLSPSSASPTPPPTHPRHPLFQMKTNAESNPQSVHHGKTHYSGLSSWWENPLIAFLDTKKVNVLFHFVKPPSASRSIATKEWDFYFIF